MHGESRYLTSYLEIVDQHRRYQQHMRFLKEAQPSIDTSPIPMNFSIAERQHRNAKNRVLQFQLEEDKLRFVNDLYEYNKQKKKGMQSKSKTTRGKKKNEFQSARIRSSHSKSNSIVNRSPNYNINKYLESSQLFNISSSIKSPRKYSKQILPKTITEKSKIQKTNEMSEYYKKLSNDYQSSYFVDVPLEYTNYMKNGHFFIDENAIFCIEVMLDESQYEDNGND